MTGEAKLVDRLGPDILRALVRPHPVTSSRKRQYAIIDAVGTALPSVFRAYDITRALRVSHFLAQAAHESDGFCTLEEYGGPSYFARYDGRSDLGNTEPGDGARYHGRGIFQLTGRANYRRFGSLLGLDLEGRPELAADPATSLRIAAAYWNERKISPAADDDDLVRVTRLINGGRNGLKERGQYLAIAKREVAALVAAGIEGGAPEKRPVLWRGTSGSAVEVLQARLRKLGYPVPLDEDFGAATELAVRAFQQRAGLKVDGIVGPATFAALYAGA